MKLPPIIPTFALLWALNHPAGTALAQPGLADLLDQAEPQTAAPESSEEAGTQQLPQPNATDAARAVASVKEIFSREFAEATTSDGKSGLARQLLAEVNKTQRPTEQWALLTEATVLMADAGDPTGMFAAIAELEQAFVVNGMALRLDGLAKVARRASPESAQALADAAMGLAEQMIDRKDFASALKCVTIASGMASKAKSPQLQALTKQAANRVREQEKAAKKTADLVAKHRANPDDPATCQELGEHLCFDIGAWERGLPLLTRGTDDELAAIARTELQTARSGSPAALADQWAGWAEKQRSPGKKAATQERAYELYTQAVTALEGLERTRVQKRMASLSESTGGALSKAKGGPKGIPGLLMWLDVGDPGSVVLAAKGQAVPRVARWKDLSGFGNDVVQSNPGQQPIFRNGAVHFDGGNVLVGTAALRLPAMTVLAVFKSTKDTVKADATIVSTMKESNFGWIIDNHGGNINFRVLGENPSRAEYRLGLNSSKTPQIVVGVVKEPGAVSCQLLGNPVSSGHQGRRVVESPVPIHLGQGTGTWRLPNFQGSVYRLIVYSRGLEPAEVATLLEWGARRPIE